MVGTYAKYFPGYESGGGGGGNGIVSINGNTSPNQTITGGTGISVNTSAGNTIITNTEPAGDAFTIIQADQGTSPTAMSPTSVLTFTNTDGNLIITGDAATNTITINLAPTVNMTSQYIYDEVTDVVPGTETTIVSYTAGSGVESFLQGIETAGQDIGELRVKLNNVVIDKQYIYYTNFNPKFDYRTDTNGAPGVMLNSGDTVSVTVINSSTGSANFNANIQILKVG